MEHFFHCPLANGLHARPASLLQERAAAFASAITLVNERNNLCADAKSTLALMGADVRHGDPCRLTVSGGDEAAAHAALVKFLQQEFPHCDNTPPLTVTPARQLPRSLTLGDGDYLTGVTVSGGVGRGQARMITEWRVPEEILNERGGAADAEFARFVAARDAIVSGLHDADHDVLVAHRSMLCDALLESKIRDALTVSGGGAGRAIHEAVNQLAAGLGGASNYLRERVLDLRDLERQLIEKIYGATAGDLPPLTVSTVVFAQHLTPSQLLAMNREFLAGLVLAEAGGTSHTAILARNFGIPTLAGIEAKHFPAADREVIVDADLGILVTNISASAERHYQRRLARALTVNEQTAAAASRPAVTLDGRPLPVYVNISTPDEIPRALKLGAEGVGLFRTEMLFIERAAPPDEDEQAAIYERAARLAAGRPLTLRTFDLGGDKPAPWLALPAERNPFLGSRGSRLYRDHAPLLLAQFRAILRASRTAPLRVLLPMVSDPAEARHALALFHEAAAALNISALPEIGLMIEVPALAFCLCELCREFSFFSVGSNDLLQYFFAADRENPAVSGLAQPLSLTFIRFLRQIVRDIHAGGRTVGLCGEIAGAPELLPLWVGLQLDSLSLGAPRIPAVKERLRVIASGQAANAVNALADSHTLEEAAQSLTVITAPPPLPLLDEKMIALNVSAASREEIIEDAADLFARNGRAKNAADVEQAFWSREEIYSTAMEHGFAIPHCKSDAVLTNSVGYLRLSQPVAWGDKLVSHIIILAMRGEGQNQEHLRTLAKLSRLLMRDEFRAALLAAGSPSAVAALLKHELGLA